MDSKLSILHEGKAQVASHLALLEKRYHVEHHPPFGALHTDTWTAESTTVRATAADVVSLLGLVALAESRGSEWQPTGEQIDSFRQTFHYNPASGESVL